MMPALTKSGRIDNRGHLDSPPLSYHRARCAGRRATIRGGTGCNARPFETAVNLVTLVMTLCVKDEEDVLDAQLAVHLAAGVDFVIATDTGSTDGTLDVLERYRRAGVLDLGRDNSEPFRQGRLRTEMARAAFERGATWVFSSDADEFWWPRGASLKAVFDALPSRYGVVFGVWRPFVPRADDGTPFFERELIPCRGFRLRRCAAGTRSRFCISRCARRLR
jgi:hypothetical protein